MISVGVRRGVVPKSFVEPLGVPPMDLVHGRELDLCYPGPGLGVDQLRLIQTVYALDECIVVGIANRSGRGGDAMAGKQVTCVQLVH